MAPASRVEFFQQNLFFRLIIRSVRQRWNLPAKCFTQIVRNLIWNTVWMTWCLMFTFLSSEILVFSDGRVCISILHAPGDDPMNYELSSERWSPVQSVEKILLSVVSMLAGMIEKLTHSFFLIDIFLPISLQNRTTNLVLMSMRQLCGANNEKSLIKLPNELLGKH